MAKKKIQEILDNLISTTKLLNYPKIKKLIEEFPRNYVTEAIKTELQKIRSTLLSVDAAELETIDMSPE